MINNQLFTPLKLSKSLKKLGYLQNTTFYWYEKTGQTYISTPSLETFKEDSDKVKVLCSAYTAEDLGTLFPDTLWITNSDVNSVRRECTFRFFRHKKQNVVMLLILPTAGNTKPLEVKKIINTSEAVARGDMLVFIKVSKYN